MLHVRTTVRTSAVQSLLTFECVELPDSAPGARPRTNEPYRRGVRTCSARHPPQSRSRMCVSTRLAAGTPPRLVPPPDFVRQPIETKDHRDMHCCKSQRAAGGCKGAHSPRRAASAAGSFAWVSLTAVFSLRSVSPSKFAVMTCACAHAASASIHAEQHNRQAGCTHVPALVGRAQQNQVTRDFFVLLQAENVTRPDGPAPSPYQTHRPPALRRGRHSSPPLSSPDHRYSPLCARALGLVSHEEATSTNFPSGASLRTGRALNSWSRR
jgi:hypothetical protein